MNYKEQIKKAIIEKIVYTRNLSKKGIKSIIDEIKNEYLWESKISLEELLQTTDYFKKHWTELKEQARILYRKQNLSGISPIQI